jgi:hypothetical protein
MTQRGAVPASGDKSDEFAGLTTTSIPVVVRWQSALPVRQALAGSNAVEEEVPNYVIVVVGLPGRVPEIVKERATLGALRAVEVKVVESGVFFVFPKTPAFTVVDREIAFSAKIGSMDVKCKFKVKDMIYQGKLAL